MESALLSSQAGVNVAHVEVLGVGVDVRTDDRFGGNK